jgi:hypothetical protein
MPDCGAGPLFCAKVKLLIKEKQRSLYAAIARHDSAQASQTVTHSSMPPTRLQSSAHSVQISAHSLHVCLWWGVLISMKWADVLQISAQAIMRRKWAGLTCFPPVSRQWFIAVDRQVL